MSYPRVELTEQESLTISDADYYERIRSAGFDAGLEGADEVLDCPYDDNDEDAVEVWFEGCLEGRKEAGLRLEV